MAPAFSILSAVSTHFPSNLERQMHLEVATDQHTLVAELAARYTDAEEGHETHLSIRKAEGRYTLLVTSIRSDTEPEAEPGAEPTPS